MLAPVFCSLVYNMPSSTFCKISVIYLSFSRRETFPSTEEGLAIVENLEHELSAMNFPAAIGHGDPNPYNIVHNADTGER